MHMNRSLVWILALGIASACDRCSPDPIDGEDAGGSGTSTFRDAAVADEDAGQPDASTGAPDGGTGDAGAQQTRTLTFNGTSPANVYFSTITNLAFTLRNSANQAVSGAAIRFTQTGTGGALNVAMVTTDALGVGVVTFNAGTTAGQMTITAAADFAVNVPVVLNVMQDPTSTIQFTLNSSAIIPVVRTETLFFTGASVPTCASLATASPLPTATFNTTFTTLPAAQTFAGQTVGHRVTAISFGYNALDQKFARVCTENLTLTGGVQPVVHTLVQDPTAFAGSYDVLLNVDLGQALPEPYETTVGTLLDILSDPVGYVVYEAMRLANANSGFTNFLLYDSDNNGSDDAVATYQMAITETGVYMVFNSVRGQVVDLVENNATVGPIYTRVTTVTGDISTAVREFEIGANYTVTTQAEAPGYHVAETWNDVIFTWHRGCPTGDEGCARRLIDGGMRLSPVASMYAAGIARSTPLMGETERFQLSPQNHVVVLRYGAVIQLLLEEIVYPELTGDPSANALLDVLESIIDCNDVGTAIANSVPLGSASFYAGYCTQGLGAVANRVDMALIELTLSGNPELVGKDASGVTADGQLFLVDADHDLQTELVRDVEQHVRWTDPNDPSLSQDVAAVRVR